MDLEHGKSTIKVVGQLIETTLEGAFNEHGANAYVNSVKPVVERLSQKPIVFLVNNIALEGGTPESYRILDEYNKWCSTQNIIAKAIVTKNKPSSSIIRTNAESYTRQNIRFFDNIDDARNWLNGKLKGQC